MTAAFEAAKNGFLVRYHDWSARQWEHELSSGFPLLRAFGGYSTGALATLEVMESMPFEDRSRLAGALVRRTHKEALLLRQVPADPEDEPLIHGWLEAIQNTRAMAEIGRGGRAPSRSALKRALQGEVEPLLGREARGVDRAQLTFEQVLGGWSIQTSFDLGGRNRQIVYRHSVFFAGRFVKPDVSPLVALGLTSTSFDRIGAGDEAQAARCVATLVRHFVEAQATLFVTDAAQAP